MLRNICVYCGSQPGRDPAYREAAAQLGEALAARGTGLVYGGGSVGLMGILADAVLRAGGRVMGVIPAFLARAEIAHTGLTERIVVPSMHERKMRMFDRSDAFLILPGGFGTLDEVMEMITWRQLSTHDKPIVFVNTLGFFDPLIAHFERAIEAGFVAERHRRLYAVAPTPGAAIDAAERDLAESPSRRPEDLVEKLKM